jgi:hypothetical protein
MFNWTADTANPHAGNAKPVLPDTATVNAARENETTQKLFNAKNRQEFEPLINADVR